MERSVYHITLDVQRNQAGWELMVKRYETHRQLRIRLLDGGKPYPVTQDCYGVFTAQKPDGTVIYNPCTWEDGVFVYDLTPQTTAAPGVVSCEIRLYGANDALLTSAAFTILVEDTVYTDGDGTIASMDEALVLTQLVSRAEEGVSRMEEVLSADLGYAIRNDKAVGDTVWSSKKTTELFCPVFRESGNIVSCNPVEGYPLQVVTSLLPIQAGQGAPRPDNIRPISGRSASTIIHGGKNLLCPKEGIPVNVAGLWVTPVEGQPQLLLDGTAEETAEFPIFTATLPAGTYTLSVNGLIPDQDWAYLQREDGVILCRKAYANRPAQVTLTDPTTFYVVLSCKEGSVYSNTPVRLQMEWGKTATDYAPYEGIAVTKELGQMIYGGSVDWSTGVVTVDRAVYDLGAFHWEPTGEGSFWTRGLVGIGHDWPKPYVADPGCLCSHYSVTDADTAMYPSQDKVVGYWTEGLYLFDEDYMEQDAQALTDALQGVQFCVPLLTPITFQTEAKTLPARKGVNSLYSLERELTVTGRAVPQEEPLPEDGVTELSVTSPGGQCFTVTVSDQGTLEITPKPKQISFELNYESHTAEAGMTWGEWMESEYAPTFVCPQCNQEKPVYAVWFDMIFQHQVCQDCENGAPQFYIATYENREEAYYRLNGMEVSTMDIIDPNRIYGLGN